MIGQYPLETIEHVRSLSPIEQVIGGHVQLRRSGAQLCGRCPFHADKTPSLYIRPDKGVFHCHGCQAGGDVFEFVRLLYNCSFRKSVEFLAARAGMNLDSFKPSPELSAKVRAMKEEREREQEFTHFYNLRVDAIGRQYRELGRQATFAETLLRQSTVPPDAEMLAWDALERYTAFQLRVEREELCDLVVIREEWEKSNGTHGNNDTASDQLAEDLGSVSRSCAGV
jgi:DNA primase